jgi:hypothetical protein
MPFRCALIVLLLWVSAGWGAELRTLTGKTISGELLTINNKEVVLRSGTEEIATPIEQVLAIDLQASNLLTKDLKYKDVELTDGTLLHCLDVKFRGKQAELTTVAGQEVKVPLSAIGYVISDAHDPKVVQTVKERFLAKKRTRDLLIVKTADGQLNPLQGTLGDADEKGETIEFEVADLNQKARPALARIHGLIFLRTPDANAPEPICKLFDNYRNTVVVSGLSLGPDGLTVTTPAGAKIAYKPELVAKLDFSKGKMEFLSDMQPVRVVETNNLERVEHYRRDQNLDGDKITLDGKKYDKGLALHAYTELEYKLDGGYEYFMCILGVDDLVGGSDGPTLVRLEGDGREIKTWTITRKDKPIPVKVPIRDVHRLKIVVASGDLLDLGKHVNLADAKVSK